jgi:hypothetical protein
MSSDVELNSIGLLKRREIEARILAPVVKALADAFGREPVLAVARAAIEDVARTQGAELAQQTGAKDMAAFRAAVEGWKHGGALELTVLHEDGRALDFDVTKCRYAQMYRELGMEELGAILSCSRDAAFAEGFNAELRLERSQTILDGAPRCDFRFRKNE